MFGIRYVVVSNIHQICSEFCCHTHEYNTCSVTLDQSSLPASIPHRVSFIIETDVNILSGKEKENGRGAFGRKKSYSFFEFQLKMQISHDVCRKIVIKYLD